jgi:DNA polymerase I-like protein with 3'-5' exonuclease and polymerase domains
MEAQVNFINTMEDFNNFVAYVTERKPEFLFIDVETDSPIEKTANLYGIGLCFDDSEAFYLPWRTKQTLKWWNNNEENTIVTYLKSLTSKTKVINHNIIFDVLVIENNLGFSFVDNIYSDTILLYHTLKEEGCDGNKPFGLKEICKQEFGDWTVKAKEALVENIQLNGGKVTATQFDFYKADTQLLGEYCGWDVLLTCKLFNKLEPDLFKQELDKLFYVEEIMPLYRLVTIPMKQKGFPVDVPYFENLKVEIEAELKTLESNVYKAIDVQVMDYVEKTLNEDYPVKNKGNFPKYLAEVIGAPLPITKDGKITISNAAVKKQLEATPRFKEFYEWLLEKPEADKEVGPAWVAGAPVILQKGGRVAKPAVVVKQWLTDSNIRKAQEKWFFDSNPDRSSVFNIFSNDDMAVLLCDILGYKPLERTKKTNKPKINDDFLELLKDKESFIRDLVDIKKLNKLLSTYVCGILDRQIEGVIYTSMLQFGTTSGRYSSRSPNLQNLPRVKEEDSGLSEVVLKYVNSIRKGFIAGTGNKIVDADYNQLEPKCFAEMGNEQRLKDVFLNGEDLYSKIAINVNGLEAQYSANKKDANYLGKLRPDLRQLFKVPSLGIVYGMGPSRLMEAINCNYKEANSIINGYLNTYPQLRKYMSQCDYEAKTLGYVKTMFGRIRHLTEVKNIATIYGDSILDFRWCNTNGLGDKRRDYKLGLNNAKNFRIQGLAGHVINRSMIEIAKEFKLRNLDASIRLMIHDQVVCVAREDQAEEVKAIMQDKMENTVKLSIPLTAVPQIGDNMAESH